ncbi:MAG: glycosyltransferase family 4 protein [Xenococcaceae cyanobacterium]
MRLTLVLPSLSGGGAERAAVLLAEGFCQRGHQVSLITIAGKETDFYQLSPQIDRIALHVAKQSPTPIHGLANNLYRLWILRQTINSWQPDVVISFLDKTNVLTLLSLLATKYPVLVCEQNNPTQNDLGRSWHLLRRLVYPLATKVVSSSQGVEQYFKWLSPQQKIVIYNPLAVPAKQSESFTLPAGVNPQQQWLVAMGRLTHQKGFDLLLKAFATIAPQYPDWQLLILGEGELRPDLEKLREQLKLVDRVCLPGLIANPFPLLSQGELFVLSSRYEGFGNVIIEAMACGLPVISTDCPSGPREIIRHGIDGLLIPNQDHNSLAQAMASLMEDKQRRQQLAQEAKQGLNKFYPETIISRWESLLTTVTLNQFDLAKS